MSDSKDLWELGQVKGRQDERERIIKLLEDTLAFDLDIGLFDFDAHCQIDREMLIALINGENK